MDHPSPDPVDALLTLADRVPRHPDPKPSWVIDELRALSEELYALLTEHSKWLGLLEGLPAVAADPKPLPGASFERIDALCHLIPALNQGRGPAPAQAALTVFMGLARRVDPPEERARAIARVLWSRGTLHAESHAHEDAIADLKAAAEGFEESASRFLSLGAPARGSEDLRRLGLIQASAISALTHQWRLQEATQVAAAVRRTLREAPPAIRHEVLAKVENNVCEAWWELRDFTETEACLRRSISHHGALSAGIGASVLPRVNLARVLGERLHFSEAMATYDEVRAWAMGHGSLLLALKIDLLRADDLRQQGRLQAALACLEGSPRSLTPPPGLLALRSRVRAGIYLECHLDRLGAEEVRQGMGHLEGLQDPSEALKLRMQSLRVQLRRARSYAPGKRRRYLLGLVRQTLEEARALCAKAQESLVLSFGLAEATLTRLAGEHAAALKQLDALGDLEREGSPSQLAELETLRLETLIELDASAALAALEQETPLPLLLQPTHAPRRAQVHARALRAQGRSAEALALCERALAAVVQQLPIVGPDVLRMGYLAERQPLYALGAALALELGAPAQALDLLSQASAPLGGASPAPVPLRPPAPSDLLADLRQKLHRLQELPEGSQGPGALGPNTNEEAISTAQTALLKAWLSAHRDPNLGGCDAEVRSTQALQKALPKDHGVLWIAHVEAQVYGLLLRRDTGLLTFALGPGEDLQGSVDRWLSLTERIPRQLQCGDDHARPILSELYDQMLRPLADSLEALSVLHVCLPPAWGDIPLHALWDGERYLLESLELRRIDHLAQVMRTSPTADLLRDAGDIALVAGDTNQGDLPSVLEEARAVAARLGAAGAQCSLALGPEANLEWLRQRAGQAHLIHLAAHGTWAAENPLFSALHLGGEKVRVLDLYALELRQRPLMMISACEGARAGELGGAGIGLGRALQVAGAGPLILALWKVVDGPTTEWVSTFYDSWLGGGISAAGALREAQLRALRAGAQVYLWAGFVYLQG